MNILIISEILARLGGVDAGKVLRNVSKKINTEENDEVKQRLLAYVDELKATYMQDPSAG
jgi:hypothetical protein